jgi:hypothetical protein
MIYYTFKLVIVINVLERSNTLQYGLYNFNILLLSINQVILPLR